MATHAAGLHEVVNAVAFFFVVSITIFSGISHFASFVSPPSAIPIVFIISPGILTTATVRYDENDTTALIAHHVIGIMMIPSAIFGSIADTWNLVFSGHTIVATAENIRSIAYAKYAILDENIHILYIIDRNPNRSPLVHSGERSHPASIANGTTSNVRDLIMRFHISVVEVDFSATVGAADGGSYHAIPATPTSAYVLSTISILYISLSIWPAVCTTVDTPVYTTKDIYRLHSSSIGRSMWRYMVDISRRRLRKRKSMQSTYQSLCTILSGLVFSGG
jgi:hypothetical protein